jgi:hypothetical protein
MPRTSNNVVDRLALTQLEKFCKAAYDKLTASGIACDSVLVQCTEAELRDELQLSFIECKAVRKVLSDHKLELSAPPQAEAPERSGSTDGSFASAPSFSNKSPEVQQFHATVREWKALFKTRREGKKQSSFSILEAFILPGHRQSKRSQSYLPMWAHAYAFAHSQRLQSPGPLRKSEVNNFYLCLWYTLGPDLDWKLFAHETDRLQRDLDMIMPAGKIPMGGAVAYFQRMIQPDAEYAGRPSNQKHLRVPDLDSWQEWSGIWWAVGTDSFESVMADKLGISVWNRIEKLLSGSMQPSGAMVQTAGQQPGGESGIHLQRVRTVPQLDFSQPAEQEQEPQLPPQQPQPKLWHPL